MTLSMHYRSVRNTRVGDKAKSDNIIANTYRLDWILDTKLILLLIVVAVSPISKIYSIHSSTQSMVIDQKK